MRLLRGLTAGQKWLAVPIGLALALAVGNLGKAVVALQYASRLPNLSTTVPLSYFAAMGGFWGIVFAVCGVGLSRFLIWGRRSTLAAVTLYQANVWLNHLLFDASDYARQTTPRDLVLTAVLLVGFWGPLSLPAARKELDSGRKRD